MRLNERIPLRCRLWIKERLYPLPALFELTGAAFTLGGIGIGIGHSANIDRTIPTRNTLSTEIVRTTIAPRPDYGYIPN